MARLNDVLWSSRELSHRHLDYLEMAMQKLRANSSMPEEQLPMNTEAAENIGVTPLPNCFESDDRSSDITTKGTFPHVH
jgi:hypothetical protein